MVGTRLSRLSQQDAERIHITGVQPIWTMHTFPSSKASEIRSVSQTPCSGPSSSKTRAARSRRTLWAPRERGYPMSSRGNHTRGNSSRSYARTGTVPSCSRASSMSRTQSWLSNTDAMALSCRITEVRLVTGSQSIHLLCFSYC